MLNMTNIQLRTGRTCPSCAQEGGTFPSCLSKPKCECRPAINERCGYCPHDFNSLCCCVNRHCLNCHEWGHYTPDCNRKAN